MSTLLLVKPVLVQIDVKLNNEFYENWFIEGDEDLSGKFQLHIDTSTPKEVAARYPGYDISFMTSVGYDFLGYEVKKTIEDQYGENKHYFWVENGKTLL